MDLLLRHLGKTIKNSKGSNSEFMNETIFSGNPTAKLIEPLVYTQRQIFGQHGLEDFRKPTIQRFRIVTVKTDFRFL